MQVLPIILFASVLFSCNSLQKQRSADIECFDSNFYQKIQKVSLNDVEGIKRMNGKFIEVEGIFRYGFEDVALYPSRPTDPAKAIWINFKISEVLSDSLLFGLNEKKVKVIGRANTLEKGHFNGYIAALDSTFCIKEIR